ncbi:MAG: HlyD family efflux transporter periplasmic adaptor subunit [Planctomycetes bacterium]|nr:HlyD family efflux transporter periplasmic adaptor subunit [Planctomycetota bacterium]
MVIARRKTLAVGLALAAAVLAVAQSNAQNQQTSVANVTPPPVERESVTLKHEPLRLRSAAEFYVPLVLEPAREVTLRATREGRLRSVEVEVGAAIGTQAEVAKLDDTRARLQSDKAQAALDMARFDLKHAQASGKADLAARAEAAVRVAQADVDLAAWELEQTIVRAPFDGRVLAVHAAAGQPLAAGQDLVTLGDTSRLRVDVPVDRSQATAGETLELTIEGQVIAGKIEDLGPLGPQFDRLREVLPEAAAASVIVENTDGKLFPGQTVRCAFLPSEAIAAISNSALRNQADGSRTVQVIRRDVVKDVAVELLGSLGEDRLYVSGGFVEGDEIIATTSRLLPDGTQVRSLAAAGDKADAQQKPAARGPAMNLPPGFKPPKK